jgi:hypothetical protein
MRRPFSRTSSAARKAALPPSAVERLPNVPKPWGAPPVSPWRTVTSSGLTPSASATICAHVVSCPCPWALEPVTSVTVPVRSTRTLPLSQPAAAGST